MNPIVARLRTERDALEIRINRELEFMRTNTFKRMCPDEKSMLHSQVHAMQAYYEILNMRLRIYANSL